MRWFSRQRGSQDEIRAGGREHPEGSARGTRVHRAFSGGRIGVFGGRCGRCSNPRAATRLRLRRFRTDSWLAPPFASGGPITLAFEMARFSRRD
jgi:hypothetical protein